MEKQVTKKKTVETRKSEIRITTSDILGKKRFLLSDIIAAFEAWKKM